MKTLTKRLLIILMLLLSSSFTGADFCLAQSLPQAEPEWTRVLARGEEFSVLLPEVPTIALKSRPHKDPRRSGGRIYGAYGDGIVYVIISENNPKQSEKIETFVAEFKRTLPRHRSLGSTELSFDREINLNNFSGKRYRVKFYNGIEGIVDFYMTKDHVYIVEVVGADESSPPIQRFFKGFSFDENAFVKEEASLSTSSTATSQPKPITNQATDQIFSSKEVTRPVFAVSRPEPSYTEEARQYQHMGTVALKAVLTSSGKVTNIEVVKRLRYGLTDKAVEAARKLKFIPAVKDGKFVSQHTQIEYNFNLH